MGWEDGPYLAFFSVHAGQEHDQLSVSWAACLTGASLVITSHGMRKRLPAEWRADLEGDWDPCSVGREGEDERLP